MVESFMPGPTNPVFTVLFAGLTILSRKRQISKSIHQAWTHNAMTLKGAHLRCLKEAYIFFGHLAVVICLRHGQCRWIHISSLIFVFILFWKIYTYIYIKNKTKKCGDHTVKLHFPITNQTKIFFLNWTTSDNYSWSSQSVTTGQNWMKNGFWFSSSLTSWPTYGISELLLSDLLQLEDLLQSLRDLGPSDAHLLALPALKFTPEKCGIREILRAPVCLKITTTKTPLSFSKTWY